MAISNNPKRDLWLENVVIPVIHLAMNPPSGAPGVHISYICTKSGVAPSTIQNWMKKKTLRPQRSTMDAVLKALGYEMGLVDSASGALVDQKSLPRNVQPMPIRRKS